MKPEFSIIIPVYKVENYLSKCLDSILLCDKMADVRERKDIVNNGKVINTEIICVYDNCEDDSFAILQKYAEQNDNIKVLKGRNRGLAGARNDGLKIAEGELVWFVDSDDSIEKDAYQVIWEQYKKTHFDIIVFGTELFPQKMDIPSFYIDTLYTRNVIYNHFKAEILFRECGAKPFVWRNCYRRDFLISSGILFDEKNLVGEDLAFQLELFPKAEKIVFIKKKLYKYLWKREGSLQDVYLQDKNVQLKGHIQIINAVTKQWMEENYDYRQWLDFYKWTIDFLGEEIPNLKNEQLIDEALKAICKIQKKVEIIGEQVGDKIKIPQFYRKELKNFQAMRNINKDRLVYKAQHALKTRGLFIFLHLIWNRIKRRYER